MAFKAKPQSAVEEQLKTIPNSYFIGWSEEYRGMSTRASVLCTIHGSTRETTASDLLRSAGCKECGYLQMASKRRQPLEEILKKLAELPHTSFIRFDGEYTNVNSFAFVRCNCGVENRVRVGCLLRGQTCKKCAVARRASLQSTPEHEREIQIGALPGISFKKWSDGAYQNSTSKVVVSCARGHTWESSVNKLLSGRGCPECAKTSRSDKKRTPRAAVETMVNARKGITFVRWCGEYKNNTSKVIAGCDLGHEWPARISDLQQGCSCPVCEVTSRALKNRAPQSEIELQIRLMHDVEFVCWETEYKNSKSRATVTCTEGHVWSTTVSNLKSGNRCPSCAKSGFDPDKKAFLYSLTPADGDCMKIGITNRPRNRFKDLKKATPFEFKSSIITSSNGHHIRQLEVEAHKLFESAGFTGFDGATEWLKVTDELLQWVMDKSKEASSL